MVNKIVSSLLSFLFMGVMLYVGVPALAVIFVQAMVFCAKDLFFHIFCKSTEINTIVSYELVSALVAFVLCLATGNLNWGW